MLSLKEENKNEGEFIAITDIKIDWIKLFHYAMAWLQLDVLLDPEGIHFNKKGRGKE